MLHTRDAKCTNVALVTLQVHAEEMVHLQKGGGREGFREGDEGGRNGCNEGGGGRKKGRQEGVTMKCITHKLRMSYSHYSPAELVTAIVECVLDKLKQGLLTNVNYI